MRSLLLAALLCVAGTAGACPAPDAEADAVGRVRATVRALEPMLVASANLSLSADARTVAPIAHDAPDAGTPAPGAVMEALARAYDTPVPVPGDAGTPLDSESLRTWTTSAAEAIRPQAILVVSGSRRDTVTQAAVYWNSPLLPRLRVVRVPPDLQHAGNRDEVLALLGTCAVSVDEWLSAPEDVALDFLANHMDASMLVVGRDAGTGAVVDTWVGPADVIDALRFQDPRTAGLDQYSAWFAGEGPGILAVTRLLPRLRSSLGPRDLLALFRSIP